LSKMLVKQGGTVAVGTVGGGCMEGDVVLHAHRLYDSGKAEILTFHLNEDDAEHGLICGGNLDVLIEPLIREQVPLFERIKDLRHKGSDCILATLIGRDSRIRLKEVLIAEQGGWNLGKLEQYSATVDLDDQLNKLYHRNETRRLTVRDGELFLESVMGCPSLIVFGGGHVSKYVSRTAAMVGFLVTIVDDRPKFANRERFPEAAHVLATNFADAFTKLEITSSSYIVIVTRGHRYDEEVLERALKTPARYIGMIGSKRKVLTTYEHLMQRGVSRESLTRIRSPIGLDIGAVTAEEIGVSIVAELVRVRRGIQEEVRHKSDSIKEQIDRLAR